MTADEIRVLTLKIQRLARTRPRAAVLIVQLVDRFLDDTDPPLDEAQADHDEAPDAGRV